MKRVDLMHSVPAFASSVELQENTHIWYSPTSGSMGSATYISARARKCNWQDYGKRNICESVRKHPFARQNMWTLAGMQSTFTKYRIVSVCYCSESLKRLNCESMGMTTKMANKRRKNMTCASCSANKSFETITLIMYLSMIAIPAVTYLQGIRSYTYPVPTSYMNMMWKIISSRFRMPMHEENEIAKNECPSKKKQARLGRAGQCVFSKRKQKYVVKHHHYVFIIIA